MRNGLILASRLPIFIGCGPEFEGEAEFTFKTSEVQKALAGQPARIRLHENVSWTMSNAYERVSFGGERFTNQLDVVKRFAGSGNLLPLHEFYSKDESDVGELTNDVVRLTVEEIPDQRPILRMEADIAVWLSQTNVLDCALGECEVDELLMLVIGSEDGALGFAENQKYRHANPRQFAYAKIGLHQYAMFSELFGNEKESGLTMASAYAVLPVFPQFITDNFYTIVGDSDKPLCVEAEDVIVNDQRHDTFKATVRRGETLRLKVNKNRNQGRIRFRIGSL